MGQHKAFPYTLDPEQIPTKRVVRVCAEDGVRVDYACPDACWREHFDGWVAQWRAGNKTAPSPQPYDHCMFSDPIGYASVPYGCTDPAMIRRAMECHARGLLDGWDRELKKTAAGRKRLAEIVASTVERLMSQQEMGCAPFFACLFAPDT